MKMLFSADVRLGAVCAENLDVNLAHKWQAARTQKLADLMDLAAQKNASYVSLLGSIFGQERVSESVIDRLFSAVKENKQIQVLALLSADEFNRISYRNDVPKNLHLLCMQTPDTYTDNNIALHIEKQTAEIQLAKNVPICVKASSEGGFVIEGLTEVQKIPSFEPVGFEDAQGLLCGCGILEWFKDHLGEYAVVENPKYRFKTIDLKILPEDGQKEVLHKINAAAKDAGPDTFLRFTITGRSAFGLTLNTGAIETRLKNKVFFAEAFDNTIMDIDEESFENDISLRSEFVRLALRDDSLSESERNRLISCGWNVLNGKEASAE